MTTPSPISSTVQSVSTAEQARLRPIARGLSYSLVLAFVIMALGGVGFWMIDPRVHNLPDGMWLAFTTAATVGYGDLVPSTSASRVFSVFVVLLGLAVLSLVTASLSALFVQRQERVIEKELLVAIHAEVQLLRDELQRMDRARVDTPPTPK